MRRKKICIGGFVLLALATVSSLSAEVKVPAIFGDHMVLQQKQTIPVWGTADPGEAVSVLFGDQKKSTVADAQGKWRIDLKAVKPSAIPQVLTIEGKNRITITDVLVGDVWLCSGQSNMEFGMQILKSDEDWKTTANQPLIRMFTVPHNTAPTPNADIGGPVPGAPLVGKWQVATLETVRLNGIWGGFSAVGYLFGRKIQQFTGQPVGLIGSHWGGSSAEAWTSMEGLRAEPALEHYVIRHQKLLDGYADALRAFPEQLADFERRDAEWRAADMPRNKALLEKWKLAVAEAEAAKTPPPPQPRVVSEPKRPDPAGGNNEPTALFNGMIAPLIPYAIKGAIWYQGETNGNRGAEYATLLPAMIQDWRKRWEEGDFPFLFVQLPNFSAKWGLLREAQLNTLHLKNTGMAITIDVGTMKDIHPPYKVPVAERLALVAEHVAYGKDLVYSGPVYRSMKVDGNRIRITFDHADDGLAIGLSILAKEGINATPQDHLQAFSIAGEDRKWYPADASIRENTVIVSSPQVPHPVAVRYGWEPLPLCNLYNKSGLPASPFRTDDWSLPQ